MTAETPIDERSRLRAFEDNFLRQLRARTQQIMSKLPTDGVSFETLPDGMEGVRATLTRLHKQDRNLLDELPGTQAQQLRFRRRIFGVLPTTVARLRAQALFDLEAVVLNQSPGPVGREEVLDALARYELLPSNQRPTAACFASATGFTPEARALIHRSQQPVLVLLGARPDGGWDVEMAENVRRSPWAQLFELESADERVQRFQRHLEEQGDLLDSRGLPLTTLAEQLGVPVREVEGLVRQACRSDSRLLTVVHDGKIHVCRSPLADEGEMMTLWSRVRRWLGLKPTPAEQVRLLTLQRVQLEQQRHALDQRVDGLEKQERETVEQGAAAKTDVEKKQLAAKLVRARRELGRVRAQAQVLTKQIDIIGTHIHNQTLAEQGRRVALPSAEALTREAAQAETVMRELTANAELAANIEVTGEAVGQSEEEAAILAEFEQAAKGDAATAGTKAPAAADRGTTEPGSATERAASRGVPAPPQRAPAEPGNRSKAGPELS